MARDSPAVEPTRFASLTPGRRRAVWAIGLALAVAGLAQHVALIRDQYQVGQLNDDGLYLSVAQTLAHGHGFRDFSALGHPAETFIPPGFPALLTIAVALGGGTAARVEVFTCMALMLPLAFFWVRRRSGSQLAATATVAVLVGSPLIANYAELVMAEAPYLATLMGALLALHHWEKSSRRLPLAAVPCLLLFVVLVYLKSAGVAVLLGLLGWWLLRRQWSRALVSAGVFAAALAPVVVSRLQAGTSVLGSDYGSQLSTFYQGGILHRLGNSVPTGLRDYVTTAVPNTLFGTSSGLLQKPGWSALGSVVTYTAVPLIAVGFLAWHRRSPDATLVIVPVYVVETLAYLHVNERRAILLAPLLAAWWVTGVGWVARSAATLATRRVSRPRRAAALHRTVAAGVAFALAVLAAVSMTSHADTDYRGESSFLLSTRTGWVSLLRAGSGPLASYYKYSSYLLTGRAEVPAGFTPCAQGVVPPAGGTQPVPDPAAVLPRLAADGAAQVLLAPWDGGPENPCMETALDADPAAVRVYRDPQQGVAVYDLLNPGARDALRGVSPRREGTRLTWSIPACAAHSIGTDGISDGQSDAAEGRAGDGTATVAVRDRRGNWHDVAALAGGVAPTGGTLGTTPGVPYWSHSLSGGLVTGVRVTWSGPAPVEVSDLRLICGSR